MNFVLTSLNCGTAAQAKVHAHLVLIAENFVSAGDALSQTISAAIKAGDLQIRKAATDKKAGRQDDLPDNVAALYLYRKEGLKAPHTVLASLNSSQPADAVEALINAFKALPVSAHTGKLLVSLVGKTDATVLSALVRATGECLYRYTATRKDPKKSAKRFERVQFAVNAVTPALRQSFDVALATAAGSRLAKDWGNLPANHATPSKLARMAETLAHQHSHMHCKVLERKQIRQLGMGAFEAVAQGSGEAPYFIVLEYRNGKAGNKKKNTEPGPVVLVGKGITFDSGGISIKPAAGMDEMKFDMCGAASVLGVFEALGRLQLAVHVVGLIPTCENLPSGQALKPGDVITSMGGDTIEVLNTDAEGRLILCDALTYARRFNPEAVIDIATLTGACVVALGAVRSGLFSNDDTLAQGLLKAGEATQDLCWRMPLDDAYAQALRSNFADIANVGSRDAGAVTAAKFLQHFVGDAFAWAHLDIAGTAWRGGAVKGATGRPVALLLQYLLDVSAVTGDGKAKGDQGVQQNAALSMQDVCLETSAKKLGVRRSRSVESVDTKTQKSPLARAPMPAKPAARSRKTAARR